ncbi:TIGR02452 family protein [Cohnella sp. LGH]|uniref:TIGR02452 family protein n=1 Tax=Cohnella sp. LGH TaxID=1619153 RepID=UPI001ADC749E|nr:TIGR02452 family protein [Cohnella sp. LGH]QTH42625.1 TIGR02452 family protein [Cohnella sp. LGH]
MNRKEIAHETVRMMEQGWYEYEGRRIDFSAQQKRSEEASVLIPPEQGREMEARVQIPEMRSAAGRDRRSVANEPTVKAILDFAKAGKPRVGVLNFASAKNPGGGFLNGAMAQEESLAASSGLYGTLLRNDEYYKANRAYSSMMYTDNAIYSPDVVFFRDERFELLHAPVTASVLTLPAVNFGQVLLKGEDPAKAEQAMKDRMRLALAIFASMGDENLILGAYGCGVFRNDPVKVAAWWRELLDSEGYGALFGEIRFSVLDAKDGKCISAFEREFG